MEGHPSEDIIGTESDELKDRNIVLCITGSVAATRCPDLCRALMRHGAKVRVVMSEKAGELITPELMHWASGNTPVTHLTGAVEHVDLAQWADIILVAPATANTISKIAGGIDDTPPTSVVSVAVGLDKPVAIVPAMHASMYTHDIVQNNIEQLKEVGLYFLEPKMEEGKAKIPSVEEIRDFVVGITRPKDLEDKRVLVTAGPTYEKVDPVRVLTNESSGKMGIALAKSARDRGADVTLIYGSGTEPEPSGVRTMRVGTTEELMDAVEEELEKFDYDLFVAAAAPHDFKPKNPSKEKMRRSESLSLELVPTQDILKRASELAPETYMVGFKAECDVSDEELEKAAKEKMEDCNLDLVVANDVKRSGAGFNTDTNEVIVFSTKHSEKIKSSKLEIADLILDNFSEE